MERENPAIKAARSIDLVEYQDGAVVSRAIIDKNVGTVTLFAFDRGQGLSEHTAPYDALVNIIDEMSANKSGTSARVKY